MNAHDTGLDMLRRNQLSVTEDGNLDTCAANINDRSGSLYHFLESCFAGNRLITDKPMLRIAYHFHLKSCAKIDLIQHKKLIFCITQHRRCIHLVTVHTVALHDFLKLRQRITKFFHMLVADASLTKRILPQIQARPYVIHLMYLLFI